MARSATDYAGAFQRLMPKGRVWRFLQGSSQAQLALALSRTMARVDAAAEALLAGSLPGDYVDLLPEWEATLGLSDSISGLTDTQRSAQIKAKFISGSGPSLPFIISYAEQLGFTITITRYAPARAGVMAAGSAVYSEEWCYVIGITVATNTNDLPTSTLIDGLQAFSAHILFILLS